MAIAHVQSGDPVDVRPLGARFEGAQSAALFKSRDLEVMRLVLPQGKSMPLHRVQGEVTLQCLEGSLEVTVAQRCQMLEAGHLMYLSGGVPHGLLARSDATALLTIALAR